MVALMRMPANAPAKTGAERRIFARKEMSATVMGRRLDHSIHARRFPTLRMHLRDLSLGGLSAIVDAPLNTGEMIGVAFPGDGHAGSWDAYGRILRCEPSGTGYRVAVEFDPLPAA